MPTDPPEPPRTSVTDDPPRRVHTPWSRGRAPGRWVLLGPAVMALAVVLALFVLSRQLVERVATVVVYCAQDQVYAEPLLRDFERETGARVRAVYDSEAVKTVGLANRLLAERAQPRCDVFWGNEELRTRQLAAAGVFRESEPWQAFGGRSRRLIINTNHLNLASAPRGLSDLTNAAWAGRVALAYPVFGSTATHFLALRAYWGEAGWRAWCQALAAQRPFVVDGNSAVVRLVTRGEAWVGLTDSDDVAAGRREGYPVAMLPLDRESLILPNTVGIVRGAPHPLLAQKLSEFLRRPDTVRRLVEASALESAETVRAGTATLEPDWPVLLAGLEAGTAQLREIFLR